jgi:hypothetical protein
VNFQAVLVYPMYVVEQCADVDDHFFQGSIIIKGKEVEMPRQVVTEKRLIARLNRELAKGENCRAHTVSAVMRVDKNENAGCNWAISAMSCCGAYSSAGNREAESVIESFQSLYNLRDASAIGTVRFGGPRNAGASA